MNIVILPILIIGCWLTYSIISGLWHVWMFHRLKLSLMRQYQSTPDQYDSWETFQEEMNKKLSLMTPHTLPEFRLIGILTTALGATAIASGLFLQMGTWAVALYTGGFVSAILGVLLIGFGMLLHTTKNNPIPPSSHQ